MNKKCPLCKKLVPLSDFSKAKSRPNGAGTYCKKCARIVAKKWRENNPEKTYRKNRHPGYLKHKYGLTLEQYDQMVEDQGGVCVVCGKPETALGTGGQIKRLTVDHNHNTGEIRALLCDGCNKVLGYAKDDPMLLLQLAIYLEKYKER